MPRPSASTVAVLAVIAACGGKVLTNGDNGSTGGGTSGATGSGTGTSGTGTGSTTVGTGTPSMTCGNAVCDPGWFCCNPSCGICAPPGGGCIEPACGSTGATGVGGGFIGGAGAGNTADCVKPATGLRGLVATDMISDLESGIEITSITPGGGWFSFRDSEVNTAFLPDPANFMASSPGLHGSTWAVHVLGKGFSPPASATNFGGGAGIALSLAGTVDLSAYVGISFWAKSASGSDIDVQFGTPDTDPRYCTCLTSGNCYATHSQLLIGVSQVERKYTVRWADLRQPTFVMAPVPFDPTNVLNIIFGSNGPVPQFDFWIDEVTLIKF